LNLHLTATLWCVLQRHEFHRSRVIKTFSTLSAVRYYATMTIHCSRVTRFHRVSERIWSKTSFPPSSQVKFNHQLCGQNGRIAILKRILLQFLVRWVRSH